MEPLTNIAVTAARRAGDVIADYYRRGDTGEITRKGENDFVTEADQRAEQAVIDTILRAYPEHGILAEESGESGDSDTVWIIDPIDGTANFIRGIPHFCVSIACRIKGMLEIGVIFDPIGNELFVGERGKGASLDGRRIRVSKTNRLHQAMIATGFTYRRGDDINTHLPRFERLLEHAAEARVGGSAALDLAYVATGRLDAYWEVGVRPWDIAAGMLLVRAAGGIVGTVDDRDPIEAGRILAATPKIYPQMLEQLTA